MAVAYALNPHRGGSEGGRAWNWIKQISRRHEVWVITPSFNKRFIDPSATHNTHFCFLNNRLPIYLAQMPGNVFQALHYCYYYWWQLVVYLIAKRLHHRFSFDITHQLTFGLMRFPSLLPRLGIPFVWGPVGGCQLMPRSFFRLFKYGAFKEIIRLIAVRTTTCDPLVRFTMKDSCIILVKNRGTLSVIPRKYHEKTRLFPSMGVFPTVVEPACASQGCLKLLYVGRLMARKGGELLLRALTEVKRQAPELRITLDIVGDGPEGRRLQELSKKLNLEGTVTFHGRKPHCEVLAMYSGADLFVFPSLREGYGAVVLEAMSSGVPCIVLDQGGPALSVTHDCGIKIKASAPEQVIRDVASAIVKLGFDPELRSQLGVKAKKRIEEQFTWDRLGERMEELYRQAMEECGQK